MATNEDNRSDLSKQVEELKRRKTNSRSNFTQSRHELLQLLEHENLPSRRQVREACKKMNSDNTTARDIITRLSDLYSKLNESEKCTFATSELEQIEAEFTAAHDTARAYLDSRKDELSSVGSEALDVDLLQEMNIRNDEPRTALRENPWSDRTVQHEVRSNQFNRTSLDSNLYATYLPVNGNDRMHVPEMPQYTSRFDRPAVGTRDWANNDPFVERQNFKMSQNVPQRGFNDPVNMYPPIDRSHAPSIGHDLWKQLKRVQIPVFSGDKRAYQGWKASFIACIDNAPATPEYKLLQLRQYLSGEALKVIDNLGHSAFAYEAAKDRLERKYGGKRRQIGIYLDELDNFRQVRAGNAKDIEEFADLLDIAIINLQEAGQDHELGVGSLYTKLQRKLPESMLARYQRWLYENNKPESVVSLRTWIIQESEFQTIAAETVHGFSRSWNTESNRVQNTYARNQNQRTFYGGSSVKYSTKNDVNRKCIVCDTQHAIWMCPVFLKMDVSERWTTAKNHRLCYRCLGEGHRGKQCLRTRRCSIDGCRDDHNRLLHKYGTYAGSEVDNNTAVKHSPGAVRENPRSSTAQGTSVREGKHDGHTENTPPQTTMLSQDNIKTGFIALRTVPVVLKNGSREIKVNALLDDGSTKTYVNADVAAELGIRGRTEKVTVNVINGQVETFETTPINLELQSESGDVSMQITAYTANRVTGDMPVIDWNNYARRWPHLKHIEFPRIESRPIVDILIGIDCADLHYAINEIRGRPGEPIAKLTPLGWTCIGNPGFTKLPMLQTNFARTYHVKGHSEIEQLNANIRKFWEIEEVSSLENQPIVKLDDKMAVNTVLESLKYENGKYEVAIPWRKCKPDLPDNYEMALRRLEHTERKLQKMPNIKKSYGDSIDQYIEKGYVRKVPECEKYMSKWYLPHFPVIKPEKDTTKTRIVFDASAKYGNVSLNDAINQGPKLQRDLVEVLLRFRKNPVALVCDIAEMYLRIGIAREDRPYQRFLWRGMNTDQSAHVYEFTRVVFGVNSSPFQAQFVARHHAEKHQEKYPLAAETVLKSTYMDDSMDSVINEETGIILYRELSTLWSMAGMHARKWLSNSQNVLKEIPASDRKSEVDLENGQLPCSKTLGVWWLANDDVFTFRENAPSSDMEYTKRNFLKKIATLFDPLGFIAPFTIRAKTLMQNMWTAGMDWDHELDANLANAARAWFSELHDLTQIQIPRCLSDTKKTASRMTLHTFVDASQDAYGTVVYARYEYENGDTSSRIIAAKSRVAPTISTSIPRLELMGAIVGVRLTMAVSNALEMDITNVTFWSDSMNVLWWIRGRSRDFKPFVANRVGEIQRSTNPDQWRYVPSKQNPADILSRGMNAAELAQADMWWRGPDFLRQLEESWPENKVKSANDADSSKEMKAHAMPPSEKSRKKSSQLQNSDEKTIDDIVNAFHTTFEDAYHLKPERWSSWLKLSRIQAWIYRFVDNCQRAANTRVTGELTADEICRAETQLIKETQRNEFSEEWTALVKGKSMSLNSKLLGLKPKLDEDGLIRSDGRLRYAEFLSYDTRFPVILPRRGWTTKLIVKHYHELGHHASGTNQTLAALSTKYWIVSGREVIREWEKECAECRKRKAKACKQIMAPLPLIRLQTSLRAFVRTSVDFGGPFVTIQGRGKRREKRYLSLFTCLSTRAVHLEIAFGLDTDSFLNALYRFVSRRGLPEEILSDNGTNFKGADNELKMLVAQLDENRINESLANKGIKWTFNPPLAPHFGGVHETLIKSAKRAMNAIIGNADINDEELMTAIIGAESLMNSRPLTYQSANPEDETPLTPNHFLHGQMGGKFAPEIVDESSFNPRKRWRRVQELVRHFWHRWIREWLPGLTARKKWFGASRDIQVGEIVLVLSPDTARGNWPLGRVVDVYPGKDGHVRVAKIQVGRTTLVRPISKLCPLECDQSSASPDSETMNTN